MAWFPLEFDETGENMFIIPERGSYRGAERDFGRVKCDGIIVLTDRRVIFHKYFGSIVEFPVEQIEALDEDTWFLHSYRNGYKHLIFVMKDGNRIGFLLRDNEKWKDCLRDHFGIECVRRHKA